MGATRSRAKQAPAEPTPAMSSSSSFPVVGIQLSFLQQWASVNVSPEETTYELCLRIKQLTAEKQCSMAELWNSQQPANRFISHSWSYKFRSLVDCLVEHEQDKAKAAGGGDLSKVYVWIDALVVNQHLASARTQEWWSHTFHGAIQTIGAVVLVLQPWSDPMVLRRAWCLWEIYGCSSANVPLEIALPKQEQEDFVHTLTHDFKRISAMLSLVDSSRAEAYLEEDLAMIRAAIESSIGHEGINRMVLTQLRAWLVSSATRALHTSAAVDDDKKQVRRETEALLSNQLARLCNQQGNLQLAIRHQQHALEVDLELYGEHAAQVARDYNNLGFLALQSGNVDLALSNLYRARDLRCRLFGPHSPEVARTEYNLGDAMEIRGDYAGAVQLFESALHSLQQAAAGDKETNGGLLDDDVMKVHGGLAQIHRRRGDYAMAERCFQSALAGGGSRGTENNHHPDVAAVWVNYAALFTDMDRFPQAESALARAKVVLRRNLGESHALVAEVDSNLARLLARQGKYEEAIASQQASMRINILQFGPEHILVAKDRNNLGYLSSQVGRLEEAETYLQASLQARKRHLGAGHPLISLTMGNIAEVLTKRGQFDAALELYDDAKAILTRINPGHANLAIMQCMTADCLYAAGRLEQARKVLTDLIAGAAAAAEATNDGNVTLKIDAKLLLAKVLTDLADYDAAKRALDDVDGLIHGGDDASSSSSFLANTQFHVNWLSGKARWMEAMGDYANAIEVQRLAVATNGSPQGLDAARDLNNLGFLLTEVPRSLEMLHEGIACLERALDIRLRVFGARNPATLRTKYNLWLARFDQEVIGGGGESKRSKALDELRQCVEVDMQEEGSMANKLHASVARLGLTKLWLFWYCGGGGGGDTQDVVERDRCSQWLAVVEAEIDKATIGQDHPLRLAVQIVRHYLVKDAQLMETAVRAFMARLPRPDMDCALYLLWLGELIPRQPLDQARLICVDELGLCPEHRFFERLRK